MPLKRWVVRKRTMFSLLVPLVFVIFARPTATLLATGVALVVIGELIRVWAAGCISKNAELACKGPFAHVRNPLYLGSLFIGAAYCVMSGLWWSVPVSVVMYWFFYWGTIVNEEEHLRGVLGDAYLTYCQAVPRLLPRLSPYQWDGQPFSWERVWYNREYQSIIGVALFTAAFFIKWLLVLQHVVR
ncbi:MAG TPA: isoprenylcysteine carboxylmethyltransferase family protein [Armatimonadota bacterium]